MSVMQKLCLNNRKHDNTVCLQWQKLCLNNRKHDIILHICDVETMS